MEKKYHHHFYIEIEDNGKVSNFMLGFIEYFEIEFSNLYGGDIPAFNFEVGEDYKGVEWNWDSEEDFGIKKIKLIGDVLERRYKFNYFDAYNELNY